MAVSLVGVGNQLGKVGAVSLADIADDPYGRTHAGSGYRRVNPFEAQAGRADLTTPISLAGWDGYDQDSVPAGTNLEVAVGYGEITVQVAYASGFRSDVCGGLFYVKGMGATEDLDVDPFTSPDTTQADAGDDGSETISLTGLIGEYVAIGHRTEFDDSVQTHQSGGASAKAGETPLTTATGISSGEAIWDTKPSIDDISQSPDPSACFAGCTECVDLTIDVTMVGPSLGTLQEKIGTGSWTTIDAAVPAGSTSLSRADRDPDIEYHYRLRYNDVSPDTWSATFSFTPECTQI